MAWLPDWIGRTLIELFHMLAGVLTTLVLAGLAAWAVPSAAQSIWWVAYVVLVIVVAMGIGPLRAARRVDRANRDASPPRHA